MTGKLPFLARDAVAFLDFTEANYPALDQTGLSGPFVAGPGLDEPSMVPGLVNYAAKFTGSAGIVGPAAAGFDALSVSVAALMLVNLQAPGEACVAAYGGEDAGPVTRFGWAFTIDRTGQDALNFRWYWTEGGVQKVSGPHPIGYRAGKWELWTISRVRLDSASFALRVYIADRVALDVVVAGNAQDYPTSRVLTMGYRQDADGLPVEDPLADTNIDSFQVFAREVTWEEHELNQALLIRDYDDARQLAQAMEPLRIDGRPAWPDTGFARAELDVEADGFAGTLNGIRELLEYSLPNRAFGAFLEGWEDVTQQPARPLDTVEARRTRVITALSRVDTYSAADISARFDDLLDGNVVLQQFSNRYQAQLNPVPNWLTLQSAGLSGPVGSGLRLRVGAGSVARWPVTAEFARQQVFTSPRAPDYAGIEAAVRITANTVAAVVSAGLVMGNRQDIIFAGVFAGEIRAAKWNYITGWTAYTDIAITPTPPYVLTLHHVGSGEYRVRIGTDFETYAVEFMESGGPAVIDRLALSAHVRPGDGTPAVNDGIEASELRTRHPNGLQPFLFTMYRDASFGGAPDYQGAEALLYRLRPGYAEGHVSETNGLVLGAGYLGRSPLTGLE